VGFGEHRVGLGGLLGWIYGFWCFLSFLVLILFLFEVFIMCFGVSIEFVRFSFFVKIKVSGLWGFEKIR